MTGSGAKVIVLGDGRMAIIKAGPAGATVEALVDAAQPSGPAVDLLVGDVITKFQILESPTADQIESAYDGLKPGTRVSIGIRRNGTDRVVAFDRPVVPAGTRMAVSGTTGAGTSAWVTGDGPSGLQEMVIAGAHIRNNDQGLPVVTFLASHPAALSVNLRTGDLIAAISGRSVAALAGLEKLYAQIPVGGEVTLTVTRAGKPVTVRFVKPVDQ